MSNAFRINKRGGCVALYIKYIYESKLVTHKTVIIDSILECVSVEIQSTHQDSSCQPFVKIIDPILNNDCLTMPVCGDFNIDLL